MSEVVREDVLNLIYFLVAQRLAGYPIEALVLYCSGWSPSDVAREYGLRKNSVKAVVITANRLCRMYACDIVKRVTSALLAIEPVMYVVDSERLVCRLCGVVKSRRGGAAYKHVLVKHRDVVEEGVNYVLRTVGLER